MWTAETDREGRGARPRFVLASGVIGAATLNILFDCATLAVEDVLSVERGPGGGRVPRTGGVNISSS
jgi:hypothetical protein